MADIFRASIDKGIKQIGRKALRPALRAGLRVTGMYWRRYYLPIHFTKAAYKRYNYHPRGGDPGSGRPFFGSYQWKKLKGYPNSEGIPSIQTTRPLVFTGRSEQTGKRGNVTPRAQSAERGYVDISIPAPALNFKRRGSSVDMRDEVTRVTAEEEKKLQDVLARDVEKRVSRILARS